MNTAKNAIRVVETLFHVKKQNKMLYPA